MWFLLASRIICPQTHAHFQGRGHLSLGMKWKKQNAGKTWLFACHLIYFSCPAVNYIGKFSWQNLGMSHVGQNMSKHRVFCDMTGRRWRRPSWIISVQEASDSNLGRSHITEFCRLTSL